MAFKWHSIHVAELQGSLHNHNAQPQAYFAGDMHTAFDKSLIFGSRPLDRSVSDRRAVGAPKKATVHTIGRRFPHASEGRGGGNWNPRRVGESNQKRKRTGMHHMTAELYFIHHSLAVLTFVTQFMDLC